MPLLRPPLLALLAFALVLSARAEDIRFPSGSRVLDVTSATYGAKGDGVTDDTAAIQAALDAAAGGRTIYTSRHQDFGKSNV